MTREENDICILIDKRSDFTVVIDGTDTLHFSEKRKMKIDTEIFARCRGTKAVILFERMIDPRNFIYLE